MREGLFLFTGPDGYFLAQEVHKWQTSFIEKFGKENCIIFTNDTISVQAIQEALQGGGLFATKKLIICKGIPDDKMGGDKPSSTITKFFETLLENDTPPFSSDVILVFVSIDPDKRLKLYKSLEKKAHIESFPMLEDKQVLLFLEQKLGSYYNADLGEYLVSLVGNNLFRLEQECDKIIQYLTFMGKNNLSEEEKKAIIYTTIESNSFGVLDAIIAGDLKKILTLIDDVAATQTARPEFIGTLYRGLKHILQTIDLYSRDIKSAKDIAAEIGMHFFPIVKNLKNIDYLTKNKTAFANVFHKLLILDAGIKSGTFPAEGFRAAVKTILFEELEKTTK